MNATEKLFEFLDSLCSSYLSLQQSRSPELFEGRGVVIPEAQVTAALSGQQPIEPWPDFDLHFSGLCDEIKKDESPFGALCRALKLSNLEIFALLLACAPEQNRKYERVFGFLQDNIAEKHASLGLASDLFSLVRKVSDSEIFALCDSSRALGRYVLSPLPAGFAGALSLRESAVIYLAGANYPGRELRPYCSLLSANAAPVPIVGGEKISGCARFAEDCFARFAEDCFARFDGKTGLLALYGAQGSGRRFALSCVAAKTGRDVLCLDCETLSGADAEARGAVIAESISYCMLQGAVPALINFDFTGFSAAEGTALAQELLSAFAGTLPLVAICGEKALKLRAGGQFCVFRYEAGGCSITEQAALWREFLKDCALPAAEGVSDISLANNFTLTPGQIRQVLSSAGAHALASGQTSLSYAEISAAVRALCRPRLAALAQPMDCRFTWDDLLLDGRAMDTLHQLCDRIRCRWQVNEEWGFDRKLPYGKGVSVLLFGPPGTGKTMTAQVLAREFGLDAYRVDLSRIMDKYIGETEKKLGELFDAAKDSNAILFFDEAEALFSKRTEVSDSKDKYANAETAYLLQRMEQHNGICLLATNNLQNFDKAFKRRITYIVSIEMPDKAMRLELWKKVFPADAPLSPTLDFDYLAEKAELTGSSIKSAALSAAYIAAAKGSDITMDILRGCIMEEMKKNGKIVAEYELML